MSSEEDVVGAGADGADKRPAKIRNVAMVVACAMLTSTNYKDLSHGPYTLPTAITNYTSYERNELLSGDVVAVDVHRVLEEILRPEPAFHAAATDHLPIYTPDMAKEAVHTIFAFVHIYKASGTTIRNFFSRIRLRVSKHVDFARQVHQRPSLHDLRFADRVLATLRPRRDCRRTQ